MIGVIYATDKEVKESGVKLLLVHPGNSHSSDYTFRLILKRYLCGCLTFFFVFYLCYLLDSVPF
jgi:hypothetical protein